VDRLFRRLQLVSAAAFSLGHGGNDAQKTMGIIAALLVGAGHLQLEANGDLPVPPWVVSPPTRPSPSGRCRAAGGS